MGQEQLKSTLAAGKQCLHQAELCGTISFAQKGHHSNLIPGLQSENLWTTTRGRRGTRNWQLGAQTSTQGLLGLRKKGYYFLSHNSMVV